MDYRHLAESAPAAGRDMADDAARLEISLSQNLRRFDKGSDAFYDQIRALRKAVRGSNPDADRGLKAKIQQKPAVPREPDAQERAKKR